MKSFLFVISAFAIFAGTAYADFDAVAWCKGRDYARSSVQYKANPENATEYFQCEKVRGKFVAYKQACKACFQFSDDTWGCTIQVPDCEVATETPITEIITYETIYCYVTGNGPAGQYVQKFRPGPGLVSYYWTVFEQEYLLPCAPGTYFNFENCKCIWCAEGTPCAGGSDRIFTFDFDGKGSENGVYSQFSTAGLQITSDSVSGLAVALDGVSGYIQVPYFQNNDFSKFTFIGYFKRDSTGSNGEQGILFNGGSPSFEDAWPASIYVVSLNPNQVKAGIVTDQGAYDITSTASVSPDEWVKVILRYDGEKLQLQVNDVLDSVQASGVTLARKTNLLFGQSYGSSDSAYYLKGKLDDLTFYRAAIDLPVSATKPASLPEDAPQTTPPYQDK
jgi:hypothetical protein